MRWRLVSTGGARQAAWLFVAAGLIGLANDAPGTFGNGRPLAVALDSVNVAIGLGSLFVPWDHWHPRVTLLLPVLALANLSINSATGLLPVSTYGVWLVLVFVWLGQWQPPRTAIMMGLVAAIAFLAPYLFGTSVTADSLSAIAISVPVAVLVGETIARKEAATRRAQASQQEALSLLALANLTDDLTGVGNRRQANVLLDSLQVGDALAILDLDHFKDVNDTLGHQVGDQVLQELGSYLRARVRGSDRTARFGGEEFIVVLRQPAAAAAAKTVQRLIEGWRSTRPLATLSAGVAIHEPGRSYNDTFANADAALYAAKAAGRDQLKTAAAQLALQPVGWTVETTER
jgi:diguanylate cyclase (GGDEF)-like protein